VATVRPGQASTEESGRLPGRKVVAGALVDPPGKAQAKARSVEVASAEKKARPRAVEVVVPATKQPKPGSAAPADAGKLPGRRTSR